MYSLFLEGGKNVRLKYSQHQPHDRPNFWDFILLNPKFLSTLVGIYLVIIGLIGLGILRI